MVVADPVSALSHLPLSFLSTTKFISSGSTHVTAIGGKVPNSRWASGCSWCASAESPGVFPTLWAMFRVLVICLALVSPPDDLLVVLLPSGLVPTCCLFLFCLCLKPPLPPNGSGHRRPTPTHLLGLQNDLKMSRFDFAELAKMHAMWEFP